MEMGPGRLSQCINGLALCIDKIFFSFLFFWQVKIQLVSVHCLQTQVMVLMGREMKQIGAAWALYM